MDITLSTSAVTAEQALDMNETLVNSVDSVEQMVESNVNLSYGPVMYNPRIYWSTTLECRITYWMQTYLPPILILFGTIGNILSFLVLRRSSHKCSVFLYMAVYALTNTLSLYVACGLLWISHITNTLYIANLADWLCKIWQFLFTVMRYTSTWLVVAMAFDRFIYLALPSWAHNLCTVFTAKLISWLIIIVLVVIGIHAMWTYELIGNQGCTIDSERRDFQTIVWPWLAATMHTYLPTLVIIIFDGIIITNLVLLSVRHYQNRNFSPVQGQLTKVVLVINISFLTLSLPTTILNLIIYLVPTEFLYDLQNYVQITFAAAVCQFLLFILCSINFPIYFLSLPMLRAEFVKMIKQATTHVSKDTANTGTENDLNTTEANGKLLHQGESTPAVDCTAITQL